MRLTGILNMNKKKFYSNLTTPYSEGTGYSFVAVISSVYLAYH